LTSRSDAFIIFPFGLVFVVSQRACGRWLQLDRIIRPAVGVRYFKEKIIEASLTYPPPLLRKCLFWLLFLPVAGFSTVVPADRPTIDEIHVTATRRPSSAVEISSSLTLIEADAVRMQKLVTDALADEVGTFLQQTTPGQGAVIIRGLKGSSILHLVDGIRLNNAIFRSAPTQYLALVPPAAVERIEVLRGSPTSLYGSDAVGGVVQVVTRVPTFTSDSTSVRGDVMVSLDTAELGQTFRGTLDVGSTAFASSLSAGYSSTGDRRTGSGERVAPSGYTSKSARLVLSMKPRNDRSWLLDLHYLKQPDTPRIDELVAGFGQTEPSSSEFSFAPNQRLFAHGAYSHGDGWLDLDWQLDLAWQRIDDDRVTRNYLATERRHEANRSDLLATTASATRQTARGSWIVGSEFYYDKVHSSRIEEDLVSGQQQSLAPRFPDHSTIRQVAVFGNIAHRLSYRHLLNGGVRFSSVAVNLPESPVFPGTDIDIDDMTADLGWIFDLADSWQLVANIGRGFRTPNIFDLGTLGERPGNRFNIPNPDLGSEQVTNFDIGVRQVSDRLRFEFSLYWLDYDDKITSVLSGDITPDGRDVVQSTNAARVTIRGAEAGADIALTNSLTARVVANYTWGEQDILNLAAEPADRIPPLSGSLRLNYDSGREFSLDAWLRFAGSQDRLSARDVRDVRIDPRGTGGWGIMGASASWTDGAAMQITAGVDNILDKQYRSHGSGIDAPGRNLFFSFTYQWH
jgi:hemoglobin/transferrin/lactoferrin receptor protein